MTKVLTVGVFDYFHLGHLRLFENAKKLGDYLIVAVQDEKYILKTKPNARIFYNTEQRIALVKALRVVDEVVVYEDVERIVPYIDFDIFAVGGDQTHRGFQQAIEWCKNHGKEVIRLQRTPNISSSSIKEELNRENT